MKFPFSQNITYKSKLSRPEILKRLQENTEPQQIFRFNKSSGKKYEGTIGEYTFDIHRIINYRNSFLPQISGAIEHKMGETIIKLSMKLNTFVKVFMYVWFFGASLGFIILLRNAFNANDFQPLLFFLFFPIALLFFIVMFNYECDVAKKDLKAIFERDELSN